MPRKPTTAQLARQIERTIPKSIGSFDATAFLEGRIGTSHIDRAHPSLTSPAELTPPLPRGTSRERGPGGEGYPSDDDSPLTNKVIEFLASTPPVHTTAAAPQNEPPPLPWLSEPRTEVSGWVGHGGGPGGEGELPEVVDNTDPATPSYPLDTSPAEPEEVSRGIHWIPKPFCSATAKSTGKRCGAFALKGRELCIFHEDDDITGFSYSQERGRETRYRHERAAVGLNELDIDFSHHFGLQMALELFLRMDLAGTISAARSARMVRYIRALQANLPHLQENGVSARLEYLEARRDALRSALALADRGAILDHDERIHRTDDRRATHEAILEANHKFARTHPKPDHNPPPPRQPTLADMLRTLGRP